MKKRSLLFALLIALIVPFAAQAQETVTIGDGTSTDYYTPIGTYYNYSITEQLYTADEIGMAGTINSISFNYASTIAKDFPITVYMANVDAENLSTGISLADAEVVFEGTYSVTGEGWMTITLDTPFEYDGTSNLLIGINKDYVYWFSGNWNHTTTEAVMARYSNNDNNAYDNSTVPANTRTARPNIQMVITPGSGVTCEKPESLEATNVTENGATLTWTGGSGNYNVEYKLASETEWTSFITNTTATTCNLTGLTPASAYQARVQSVCDDATSGWKSVNFTTSCGAITTFPWTETFESYASGDFVDPCWVNEHISGSGTQIFKVYTSSNSGNATHQLQLPDMAEGTLTKLVLPEMTLPENYEFSIDIYRSSSTYNENYPNEGIRVYASADGEIEGATELAFIPRHYAVSNDVIPAESAVGWYTYELPIGMSGTCYIILRGESQYCTATYMDNLTVKAMPTCPKPTGLAVTANSVTAHNATITWTENGEANTWIVEYSTSADFAEVLTETVEDTPTYTFAGLEPETTYYVRVKAHCGDGDESEYSNVVNFTTAIACPAPTGLAVNPGNYSASVNWNGTSESYIVSYRTAAYAEGIVEEFNSYGVPSGWTQYSGLVDEVIAGEADLTTTTSVWASNTYALGQYNMKVNIYGSSVKYWLVTPEFNLSQNLSFDLALTDYGNADPIENPEAQADDRFVVLVYADNAWHILREWNNSGSEYVYNAISATGENVSIDLSAYYGQDVKIAFYGESTSSTGENAGDNDLHIDNVICGIPYEAGEWQTITTTETTATITDLNPETAYEVKVQGDCGELDGVSLETAIVTFTTLEGCPVPQNVDVEDVTSNSAAVAWDGYNDSYNVSYRMAAHSDGIIEHFDAQSIPAGWTKYSGLVDQVVAGTAELSLATSGWALNSYALGQYNMKLNIYGESYVKYWLVTPEFKPSQDLTFDLALTDYNNSDPIENDTWQADDRFIVLVYADDAWHILREWNNSGSEYVYNTISTTGESVTIDLSAYYGKKVKIAFYGESTSSTEENAGDNDLHIDNIVCGTPIEAGEWENVEATESPVVLNGLTPETPYDVKVQGVCGETETEWTNVVTFTTLEEPITYTLTIEGYEEDNNDGGYHLIASPVTVDLTNHAMTTGDFDLYSFDEGEEDEWRNYEAGAFTTLEPGKGYLYAHKIGGDFILSGTAYTGNGEVTLQKTTGAQLEGWNLVGNPYADEAYIDRPYYRIDGAAVLDETEEGAINAMEGVFVIAEEDEETITFRTEQTGSKVSRLAINLSQGHNIMDRAIVRFDGGRQLPKFQLNENSTKVFIPQEGKDFAVVRSEAMGEMPVSFKAQSNGSYTFSFNAEEVSFAYLHLIDNMTGVETDLLANPSYSFEASTTDYANRFKLVFATGNADDDFAFFSNGSFVINNEGMATVQVMDVNGRILSSESINGCANVNVKAAAGVYMIRLVNGSNVKVQKVVVK